MDTTGRVDAIGQNKRPSQLDKLNKIKEMYNNITNKGGGYANGSFIGCLLNGSQQVPSQTTNA